MAWRESTVYTRLSRTENIECVSRCCLRPSGPCHVAPEEQAVTVEFPLTVDDATAESRKRPSALPNPYELKIVSDPAQPKAGEEVELRLSVTLGNTIDRRTATDFEEVHQKLMHLFLLRSDLGQFVHEHPKPGADGVFVLRYTFPTGGFYRVFVDVAPSKPDRKSWLANSSWTEGNNAGTPDPT
jgi:hypothetical protein